jgi:tetratricopeptide (TPR) repeat protein
VDREELLAEFDGALDRPGTARLLVLTGVGGIGKSRLLHELRRRANERSQRVGGSEFPAALLNLQEPVQRTHISALASLRMQFGSARVRFDRFDIAYAVWWQRLNPQVALTRERLPFLRNSEAVAVVLDEVADVPVFGSALRVTEILARRLRRWRTIRHDATLQELDELAPEQLGDAVTYLFAQELNALDDYLLCVDAYEALVGGLQRLGRARYVDVWLRDLVWQLDRGLVAVASREPLGWDGHDPQWGRRARELLVAELPFDSRLELLTALGVAADERAQAIALECAGLPYYLHLAHETGSASGAFPRIEERFLYHVEPEMVRLLELLSVARIFDHEIFTRLAAHFGMRSDVIVWETLIGYSFVSSAGVETLQLHQLMSQAISSRQSERVRQELHLVLHEVWQARAAATSSLQAWREAAYHAARTAEPPLATLIDYADQACALAGRPGLDALLADLPEDSRLRPLWAAESALLWGDAAAALAATARIGADLPAAADEVDARLAVAAANGYRILGDTAEAVSRYGTVWAGYDGPVALDAGVWYVDLQMARGQFVTAIDSATQMTQRCPPERTATRGDLARLRFLAHRFCFDTESAAAALERARTHYAAAGHVVGQANVATNTVELLALTDPAAAVEAAEPALAAQQRLGAEHELGKIHTALALAHVSLGELEQAGAALERAVTVLERCGYRSGRARAELVTALWHARAGRRQQARDCCVWAVEEFGTVDVYPTLVMVAAVLLDRIGQPDPGATAAADRAAASVQPAHGMARLRSQIRQAVCRSIGDKWDTVYAAAAASETALSGFYHRNVRVDEYLVRVPLPAADRMDLHIWPEPAVLAAVQDHVPAAAMLRAVSHDPPYQVHDWIEGTLLDAVAPRGTRVPDGVIAECAQLFGDLAQVPARQLPPLPPDWPRDGDTVGFAERLLAVTRGVHDRFAASYRQLWQALEIPTDPFESLTLHQLQPRPCRLVHCDVHRKNIILQANDNPAGPLCRFLDWELALWGDPVYELAVHLHKMAYQPDEEQAFCTAWRQAVQAGQWPGWQDDLAAYRAHEQVKSAVVDSVRYAQLLATAPQQRAARVASLVTKLNAARRVWGIRGPADPQRVAAALDAART